RAGGRLVPGRRFERARPRARRQDRQGLRARRGDAGSALVSVLVAGLNYKSTPLDLLEQFSFDATELGKALHAARASEHVREAVILSTCNRTEVYAVVDGFHSGVGALRQFLSEFHHVAPEDFTDRLYGLYEDEAVTHLFAVASGIDSMVVGEPQILSQVRRAFLVAERAGGTAVAMAYLQIALVPSAPVFPSVWSDNRLPPPDVWCSARVARIRAWVRSGPAGAGDVVEAPSKAKRLALSCVA